MAINKKEFEALTPEARIKKLKQLEVERKKEVEEIGELIKKSMQELRTGKLAEEITPEQRPVDIARLFETSAEQRLERTANEEMPATALSKGAKGYVTFTQAYESYKKLKRFDTALSMGSSLTEAQKAEVGRAGERIITDRYAPVGEETADLLNAGRAIFYKLEKELGLPRRLKS